MRYPDPPFLEIGLYFADRDGRRALLDLFQYFESHGGSLEGRVQIHREANRPSAESWILGDPTTEVTVRDREQLLQLFADPNVRVVQVYMCNATRVVPDALEIATQLSISPEASRRGDNHPVAIWMEGEAFSRPPGFPIEPARTIGLRAFATFTNIVQSLKPSYGVLQVDGSLECLSDLRENVPSHPFETFYVSNEFGASDVADATRAFVPDAFCEVTSHGVIVDTVDASKLFPAHELMESDDSKEHLSSSVVNILLQHGHSRGSEQA